MLTVQIDRITNEITNEFYIDYKIINYTHTTVFDSVWDKLVTMIATDRSTPELVQITSQPHNRTILHNGTYRIADFLVLLDQEIDLYDAINREKSNWDRYSCY